VSRIKADDWAAVTPAPERSAPGVGDAGAGDTAPAAGGARIATSGERGGGGDGDGDGDGAQPSARRTPGCAETCAEKAGEGAGAVSVSAGSSAGGAPTIACGEDAATGD
jgi:hypothetical protein